MDMLTRLEQHDFHQCKETFNNAVNHVLYLMLQKNKTHVELNDCYQPRLTFESDNHQHLTPIWKTLSKHPDSLFHG